MKTITFPVERWRYFASTLHRLAISKSKLLAFYIDMLIEGKRGSVSIAFKPDDLAFFEVVAHMCLVFDIGGYHE